MEESMVEREDGFEEEMSDMAEESLGMESLPCSHPLSGSPSMPAERPVPAPQKREEETVKGDTPVQIYCNR